MAELMEESGTRACLISELILDPSFLQKKKKKEKEKQVLAGDNIC